ncbi:MAG: phosphoribosylanthranilate isomerase [Verrucomicrobiota bacterium]
MRVKIKICGITSIPDAMGAIEAGADALGLMLWAPSKRYVTNKQAAEIARAVPPFVSRVGVFVNATLDEIRRAIEEVGIDTVQFHGDEPPEFCQQIRGVKTVKAFQIQNVHSLKQLSAFDTDAWLLDSFAKGKRGGTGETFNWDLAVEAKDWARPIILAGGLTPENVAQAVHEVWPYGVDVSTGVESAPGRKDPKMIRHFVEAVRSIEGERY